MNQWGIVLFAVLGLFAYLIGSQLIRDYREIGWKGIVGMILVGIIMLVGGGVLIKACGSPQYGP